MGVKETIHFSKAILWTREHGITQVSATEENQ